LSGAASQSIKTTSQKASYVISRLPSSRDCKPRQDEGLKCQRILIIKDEAMISLAPCEAACTVRRSPTAPRYHPMDRRPVWPSIQVMPLWGRNPHHRLAVVGKAIQAERANGAINRVAGTSGGGLNSPASISAITFSVSPTMWRAYWPRWRKIDSRVTVWRTARGLI
jgi:hypothetical protein